MKKQAFVQDMRVSTEALLSLDNIVAGTLSWAKKFGELITNGKFEYMCS